LQLSPGSVAATHNITCNQQQKHKELATQLAQVQRLHMSWLPATSNLTPASCLLPSLPGHSNNFICATATNVQRATACNLAKLLSVNNCQGLWLEKKRNTTAKMLQQVFSHFMSYKGVCVWKVFPFLWAAQHLWIFICFCGNTPPPPPPLRLSPLATILFAATPISRVCG